MENVNIKISKHNKENNIYDRLKEMVLDMSDNQLDKLVDFMIDLLDEEQTGYKKEGVCI